MRTPYLLLIASVAACASSVPTATRLRVNQTGLMARLMALSSLPSEGAIGPGGAPSRATETTGGKQHKPLTRQKRQPAAPTPVSPQSDPSLGGAPSQQTSE